MFFRLICCFCAILSFTSGWSFCIAMNRVVCDHDSNIRFGFVFFFLSKKMIKLTKPNIFIVLFLEQREGDRGWKWRAASHARREEVANTFGPQSMDLVSVLCGSQRVEDRGDRRLWCAGLMREKRESRESIPAAEKGSCYGYYWYYMEGSNQTCQLEVGFRERRWACIYTSTLPL